MADGVLGSACATSVPWRHVAKNANFSLPTSRRARPVPVAKSPVPPWEFEVAPRGGIGRCNDAALPLDALWRLRRRPHLLGDSERPLVPRCRAHFARQSWACSYGRGDVRLVLQPALASPMHVDVVREALLGRGAEDKRVAQPSIPPATKLPAAVIPVRFMRIGRGAARGAMRRARFAAL